MGRLELVETSLRHGQQRLILSRLRERHAVEVAKQLDACGFAGIECFGGATFEAQLRFLGENPFERLRAIRQAAPSTPLAGYIRGQALVSHRHVADDVVDAFVHVCADAGLDAIRCGDPLNDIRNMERCIAAAKKSKLTVEGVVVYNDAPAANGNRLVAMVKALTERGCDSLVLHDPLGVLGPARAKEVVASIIKASKLPLTISFSAQTGQADLAYLAGLQAGATRADVSLAPLAGGAAFPAAEALVAALRGGDYDTGLDLDRIANASATLESVLVHYGDIADPLAMRLDTAALRGMLPPSAMGPALTELRNSDATDRLDEVEAEVRVVRQDLGLPPFMTPLTEIIATQAVYNVIDGERYSTISQEVKDYCLGLYGAPPAEIDADVRRIVNGREEPITCRPADLLDPALPPARKELKREGMGTDETLVVTYAMFPTELLALQRGEAQVELLGDEAVEETSAVSAPSISTEVVVAEPTTNGAAPVSAQEVRDLTVEVDGQSYDVRVIGAAGSFGGGGAPSTTASTAAKPAVGEGTVVAPMQGLILKVNVSVGDKVELGDVVAVLEAMKMQNDVIATKAGTVSAVFVQEGAVVGSNDPVVNVE